MNLHRPSRSCHPLFLLVIATLLLTASQLTGGAAAQVLNESLAAKYFDETLLGRNDSVTARLVASGARIITPEGTFIGPEGIDQFLATLDASFTDLVFVPEEYVVDNNVVTINFTITGLHTGDYHGFAPMCAGVAVSGVATLQFDGSVITEQWLTYDRDTLLAQIDGFHQLDPTYRPDCAAYTESQAVVAPALVPERVPVPNDAPGPGTNSTLEATCIRRDHCEAPL